VARKVEDAKVKVGQDVRARCELLFALDAASLEAIDLAEKAGRCGENVALKLAACSWPSRHVLNPQETSSKWQLSSLQSLALATAKRHATEGRRAPAACSWPCLTPLSESTRS